MFSVLHRSSDGRETLRQAMVVRSHKETPSGASNPCVSIHSDETDSGEVMWVFDGHVFVMNDAGKTVSRFCITGLDA